MGSVAHQSPCFFCRPSRCRWHYRPGGRGGVLAHAAGGAATGSCCGGAGNQREPWRSDMERSDINIVVLWDFVVVLLWDFMMVLWDLMVVYVIWNGIYHVSSVKQTSVG